jgi:hypothetical protein
MIEAETKSERGAGKANGRKKGAGSGVPTGTAEAFARMEKTLAKAAFSAADAEKLAGLEVSATVTAVLAALPAITAQRAAIVAALPSHPIALLDELEDRALAAWHANLLAVHAQGAKTEIEPLEQEGKRLREDLLIAAEPLAHRDLLDRAKLTDIRLGDAPMAADLVALGELYMSGWSKIAGKTPVEKKEVERATKLGAELTLALETQQQLAHLAELGDAEEVRGKALALVVEAYDACRRALAYVRWNEGDLETIAPALKKKVARAKKTPGEETPPPPAVAEN